MAFLLDGPEMEVISIFCIFYDIGTLCLVSLNFFETLLLPRHSSAQDSV